MEKTIKIGGKDINFKATGGTLCIYKQQFGTEYYDDIYRLNVMKEHGGHSASEIYLEQYKLGYRIIWAMAKNADDTIPDPETWSAQFKTFPMAEILPQVTALFRTSENEENAEKGGENITSERLLACAVACGFTKKDVYELPIGFLINCISEAIDLKGGEKEDTVREANQQDFMNF